ncbi:MAG: hypothetical protein RTU30_05960 [Candidatus Thorarchaeota archaeon]
MEISQRMRDEIALHNWKLMKLDRCRAFWGLGENYKFPNGIRVLMYVGRRPLKVKVDVEYAGEVESLLGDIKFTKKVKKGIIEFSMPFENRGIFLDLLWSLYIIGMESESLEW